MCSLPEDALQVEQRPKMDEYEHGVFVVVPMLKVSNGGGGLQTSGGSELPGHRRSRTPQETMTTTAKFGGSYDIGACAALDPRRLTIEVESVSIFVIEAENTILTIQEKPGDCWRALRQQLNHSWSRVRSEASPDIDLATLCLNSF